VSRASSQRGYALLAALVVTALAAVFAAAAVAAVSATQSIMSADTASIRAQAVARQALARVCLELKRHPATREGDLASPAATDEDESWQANWVAAGAETGVSWPAVVVHVVTTRGVASARLSAVVQLRTEVVPQGLVTAGDAELRAPLRASGAGFYCGGCLRGREWLEFANPGLMAGQTPPADGVHADLWPQSGAHALGGVWAGGEEIHTRPDAGYAQDTDTHTAHNEVSSWVAPPDSALVIELRDDAVAPGEALCGDTLDLAKLPLTRPFGRDVTCGGDGYVVVISPVEGSEVQVVGARPPGACPVVLVVEGDASLGEAGSQAEFEGALLVSGSLQVHGPASLRGHLFAGDLVVSAPLTVELPSDWRERPLSGLALPTVVALDRP
jgi:type II secretory pathway pseudopilin PulG